MSQKKSEVVSITTISTASHLMRPLSFFCYTETIYTIVGCTRKTATKRHGVKAEDARH